MVFLEDVFQKIHGVRWEKIHKKKSSGNFLKKFWNWSSNMSRYIICKNQANPWDDPDQFSENWLNWFGLTLECLKPIKRPVGGQKLTLIKLIRNDFNTVGETLESALQISSNKKDYQKLVRSVMSSTSETQQRGQ